MADINTVVLLGAVIGAALNVVRGWNNSPEGWNLKLVVGGLITGIIGSLALVQVLAVPVDASPVSLIVLGILTGFTSDFAVSKLK